MTLNITVLTSKAIYQSADYRLFDATTQKPLSIPSDKTILLHQSDWVGFITYTGIGRVGTKNTSAFVRDWLVGLGSASFDEVVDAVRHKASSWIQKVAPSQEHTFVVAAFLGGKPTAAVVSNFQKWHGADLSSVSKSFFTSAIVASHRPEVIVTGVRDAVPRLRRRALQKLAASHPDDHARIRRALAKVTENGAQRYPDWISDDCYVYSQDRNGRGSAESFGNPHSNPTTLTRGIDTSQIIKPTLEKTFGPGKWISKGTTFARSGDSIVPPSTCVLRLSANNSKSRYRVIELASPDGQRATPRSANAQGIVVGEGTPHYPGPSYPCVWPTATELKFLPHGGGVGGSAYDINDLGTIVGASEMPDRALHAQVWRLDEPTLYLGHELGRYSAARSVNRAGSVVGYASIHPTESGQMHHRPAAWPNSGKPAVLEDLAGDWGEVVDINTSGLMVIRCHTGRDVGAWLWDGHEQRELGKPSPEFRVFWPKKLTEDDAVVGLTIRSDGQRGAAARRADGTWSELLTPASGREFTAANGMRVLAGYDTIDHYQLPWVMREKEEITYLPHFQHHQHQPTMVSEQGWVLGTASSDNCYHPLLWIPE